MLDLTCIDLFNTVQIVGEPTPNYLLMGKGIPLLGHINPCHFKILLS